MSEVLDGAELGVCVVTCPPGFCSVLVLLTTGRHRYSFAHLLASCMLHPTRKPETADISVTKLRLSKNLVDVVCGVY